MSGLAEASAAELERRTYPCTYCGAVPAAPCLTFRGLLRAVSHSARHNWSAAEGGPAVSTPTPKVRPT